MIFRKIYMFIFGFVDIIVEGFFVERFINICKNREIFLENLKKENSTYLKAKVLKSDFKEIRHIAKISKCKVKIQRKRGIPFFINKYRKRKIFAVAILVIAIFIFISTRFVWNIEVEGNEKVEEKIILENLENLGIKKGVLKSNIDTESIINSLRLEIDELSWVSINIVGTNVIVSVKEITETPEIIDKDEICNIIATKDTIIDKITVHSGTARVSEGDVVKKGDILVEGIMEGEYVEDRLVHADANIIGLVYYEKEKKENFLQNKKTETGNVEIKREICINNFKINLNKKLSKFEIYDTMYSNSKIKLFSNFYLPVEIIKTTNIEIKNEMVEYSEEELKSKIESELDEELENEYNISNYEDKTKSVQVVEKDENGICLKVVYEVKDMQISTKVKVDK